MQKNTPSKPAPHSNPARQGRRSISSDEALAVLRMKKSMMNLGTRLNRQATARSMHIEAHVCSLVQLCAFFLAVLSSAEPGLWKVKLLIAILMSHDTKNIEP